jgi:hypothetical protein
MQRNEVMIKEKEGKKSKKAKENSKNKEIKKSKEFSKTKMPVVTNYYPEELPKR